ncbi:hypothetical protein [Aurantiacibacter zhengii]|uniref:Uncharacterized protein n=1 Tax=Aurantiacibacter zhengii TaxID=2307003 RepID=A0A418NR95_9SPHN|nr:hypothetical protein [Aurantiacibacter zhengii]RIV85679.1 hypothetical protein D2V07_10075 [Aurantiacibacter zhengii]
MLEADDGMQQQILEESRETESVRGEAWKIYCDSLSDDGPLCTGGAAALMSDPSDASPPSELVVTGSCKSWGAAAWARSIS